MNYGYGILVNFIDSVFKPSVLLVVLFINNTRTFELHVFVTVNVNIAPSKVAYEHELVYTYIVFNYVLLSIF